MPSYWMVEDANDPAILNSFSIDSSNYKRIIRNTIPEIFRDPGSAKAFAIRCKKYFPDSNPTVVSRLLDAHLARFV